MNRCQVITMYLIGNEKDGEKTVVIVEPETGSISENVCVSAPAESWYSEMKGLAHVINVLPSIA